MVRWLFITLLALQAHFGASYLVPLDEQAQREFGGLLRWAWPWALGDHGPLGRMTSTAIPLAGFFLAVTVAGASIMAVLALFRTWVPFDWWRALAITGAVSSLALMASFFGATKLLPIATAVVILAAGLDYWSPMERR